MYKSRLQELCQQRQLSLPEYTTTRDGPDHCPRFRATVTVDDLSFDSLGPSMNAKEAQNRVAELAFKHLSAITPAPPLMDQIEYKIPYKCELLRLAQTKMLDPPTYDSIREGPPHALQFKAIVTVDGQKFVSPQFFGTLKEAEHSAAKIAIQSWSSGENKVEDPGFYKNLLQELAQKERFSMPKYITISDGASHIPTFSSKVEIKGETFSGESATTKKQAEMNAAKVAWCELKERRVSGPRPSGCEMPEASFASLGSTVEIRDVQLSGSSDSKSLSNAVIGDISENNSQANISLPDSKSKAMTDEELVQNTESEDQTLPCPSQSDFSNHGAASASAPSSEAPLFSGTCSLLSGRVRVYSRKPDMLLPEGAVMLPFSDDAWVAVSLDISGQV
ncbi:Double-stranded RNA-binding domain-containing protein [Dioscorea alata]|uniref:Double-stranded RNA-binding domain-containing protein n=1 Tax=Dioscorea alata TaxID=55571 RepID=A0ACB7UHW5_DIOAL|nr:Double-stranded RNA-binding domain-containing protein [Dioscorea alata]